MWVLLKVHGNAYYGKLQIIQKFALKYDIFVSLEVSLHVCVWFVNYILILGEGKKQ